MNRSVITIATVIIVFATNAFAEDTVVTHRNPTFTVTVPSDFTHLECEPPVLYLFHASNLVCRNVILEIADLNGSIRPGRRSREEIRAILPPETDFDLEYWDLMGEQITAVHITRTENGFTEVHYSALIPLSTGGIRISVAGPDPKMAQYYRRYLQRTVSSLQGELLKSGSFGTVSGRPIGLPHRIMLLCGGGLSVVGFCTLAVYLLLRLCLIGRSHKLIAMRSRWLAIAGATLLLGSAIRGMTFFMYNRYTEFIPMVVGLGLAFLVINAHLRLAKIKAANQALAASQHIMIEDGQCEQPEDGRH